MSRPVQQRIGDLRIRLETFPVEARFLVVGRAALRALPAIGRYVGHSEDLAGFRRDASYATHFASSVLSAGAALLLPILHPNRSALLIPFAEAVSGFARQAEIDGDPTGNAYMPQPTCQQVNAMAAGNVAHALAQACYGTAEGLASAMLLSEEAINWSRGSQEALEAIMVDLNSANLPSPNGIGGTSALPLWPNGTPDELRREWAFLRSFLLARPETGLEGWALWYDRILAGSALIDRNYGVTSEPAPRCSSEAMDGPKHFFISHSTKDGLQQAKGVVNELERTGEICWYAPRNVREAEAFPGQIVDAIENCALFVLILTPGAALSLDVLQEVIIAHSEKRVIAPVIVEATEAGRHLRYYLSARQKILWSDPSTMALTLKKVRDAQG